MKHMIRFTGLNGEPCYKFKKAFKARLEEIKNLDPFIIGSKLSNGVKLTPAKIYKYLYCKVFEDDKIAQGFRKYYKYLLLEKEVRELNKHINSLRKEFEKEAQQYAESRNINNPHYNLDTVQKVKLAELQRDYFRKSEEVQALLKELKAEGIINRNGLAL